MINIEDEDEDIQRHQNTQWHDIETVLKAKLYKIYG